jgi:hypothetical protein
MRLLQSEQHIFIVLGYKKSLEGKKKKLTSSVRQNRQKNAFLRFQEEILFKKKDNLISALKGLNIRFYLPGE